MSIKLKTEKFKLLVNIVARGAVDNKLVPTTSLIGITASQNENTVKLYSFDKSNHVIASYTTEVDADIDISVNASTFSKLISKLTSDLIEISVDENSLTVEGNGTYSLPLISDESGNVKFPKPVLLDPNENYFEVSLSVVNRILAINKSSAAKTFEMPSITGYRVSPDNVTTTNATTVCFNNVKFTDDDVLISPTMMDLISCFDTELIKYKRENNTVMFYSDTLCIIGETLDSVDSYPDVSAFASMEYPSKCVIYRDMLSATLDRLSLFVDPFYLNSAYLTFEPNSVTITSRNGEFEETINYAESDVSETYKCCVNVPMFKTDIDTVDADNIELHFGVGSTISIKTDSFVKVTALVDDNA